VGTGNPCGVTGWVEVDTHTGINSSTYQLQNKPLIIHNGQKMNEILCNHHSTLFLSFLTQYLTILDHLWLKIMGKPMPVHSVGISSVLRPKTQILFNNP
jgi:hypothetical protein